MRRKPETELITIRDPHLSVRIWTNPKRWALARSQPFVCLPGIESLTMQAFTLHADYDVLPLGATSRLVSLMGVEWQIELRYERMHELLLEMLTVAGAGSTMRGAAAEYVAWEAKVRLPGVTYHWQQLVPSGDIEIQPWPGGYSVGFIGNQTPRVRGPRARQSPFYELSQALA